MAMANRDNRDVLATDSKDSDTNPRILILGCEEVSGSNCLLHGTLTRHAYFVDQVHTAADMKRGFSSTEYDIVIFDFVLPDADGLEVLKWLRFQQNLPGIIIRSELGDEIDRIVAFELGADDYVTKSCSPREVGARIRAILRRRLSEKRRHEGMPGYSGDGLPQHTLPFGDWTLYSQNRQLRCPTGDVIKLSIMEYSILSCLFNDPASIKDREDLIDTPAESPDRRSADVHVSRLRKKLALYGGQDLIQTVRGRGYKVVDRST